MTAATVILHWKKDVLPAFVTPKTLAAWEKGKKIFQVDPVAIRQEGSFYIEAGLHVVPNRQALIEENKRKFDALSARLGRFKRAYLMATGPSVSRYKFYDYSDAITIVCNSVILDEELMAQVKPKILVFADPIFHFGPSQYAAAFREKLRQSAALHDFTICIPFKYYALFVSAMPDLRDRTIAVPFTKDRNFNFDLRDEFFTKTTANILTFLMVPLGTTFADEVGILGCDGRPLTENTYFWNHNPSTQINDKMANIREVHPGFFAIDYNDYYLDHCKTLESLFQEGEKVGKRFTSLGFSHIPALRSRIGVGKRVDYLNNAVVPRKIFLVDPDAKSWSGHYMAYNEKLSAQLKQLDSDVHVICRKDLDPEILKTRPDYIPAISAHSWEIGNRTENTTFLSSFESEILEVLSKECTPGYSCLLYMYCSSLAHAKVLAKIQTKYPSLQVNVNLFYLSFTIGREWIENWKPFIEWLDSRDSNFIATLPTVELRDELAELTGCVLPVAPHPSTGILDETFFKLESRRQTSLRSSKFNVLFPSAPRLEKGYLTSVECARALGKESTVNTIVRHSPTFSTPKALAKPLEDMPRNATVIKGELSDEEFVNLFSQSDIVVLPYTAEAFAKRTSGLLIDATYQGIPCVVVDGTWLANFVRHYGCGVIVNEASAVELAEGVMQIAANYERYQSKAAVAAADYFSKNSWDEFGKFLLAPYWESASTLIRKDRVPTSRPIEISNIRRPQSEILTASDAMVSNSFLLDVQPSSAGISFRGVTAESQFSPNGLDKWQYVPGNINKRSHWMAVFDIDDSVGLGFAAGLAIKVSATARIRVSLARHGNTSYEGTSETVIVTSGKETKVAIKTMFANSHAALKVQIEVLFMEEDSMDLSISRVYLNETSAGIRQRLGAYEPDLSMANRMFRKKDYATAMALYLELSTMRPLSIYVDNALASARHMKWGDVRTEQDLKRRLAF